LDFAERALPFAIACSLLSLRAPERRVAISQLHLYRISIVSLSCLHCVSDLYQPNQLNELNELNTSARGNPTVGNFAIHLAFGFCHLDFACPLSFDICHSLATLLAVL
jgi:hypothetical protein